MYLEFKNVDFSYNDAKVLKNVSFGLEKGTVTGLIGANGAGKTTTILNIVKKLEPEKGKIYIGGKDIRKISGTDLKMAYIPDNPVYYEELTVWEHLQFVHSLYPNKSIDLTALVDTLKLGKHLYKIPSMLSKGTLQKLMIALALIREYELLIADEPFSGLDPEQINVLKQILLQNKNEEKAILISTHLLDIVESLCDKYIMISDGRILVEGTKVDIARHYHMDYSASLEHIYLTAIKDLRRTICMRIR